MHMPPTKSPGWLALLLVGLSGHAQSPTDAVVPAAAGLPEYRIEVIIFENTDVNSAEEDFSRASAAALPTGAGPAEVDVLEPALPALPVLDELLSELSEPGDPALPMTDGTDRPVAGVPAQPFRFKLLGPDDLELKGAYATLTRLPAYRPLLHGGWIQEGLPPEQAHRFDLSVLGVTNPRGSIELYLSRFLHVDLDLSYQQSTTPVAADSTALTEFSLTPRFRLRSERRLRSGELHFFDHPAFGVLLIVKPMPAAPNATQAPAT
jgi:hypothetical protein